MFSKKDYIPFLFGLFILGGLILVPKIWGGIVGLDEEDAILPALISCAVFGFSLNQVGVLSLGRFIGLSIGALGVMTYASMADTDSTAPVFLAGGVLGYAVMIASGWAGIWAARLTGAEDKFQFLRDAKVDKANDIAERLIWGVLIASLMVHTTLTRTKAQKRAYYKSLWKQTAPEIYRPTSFKPAASSVPKKETPYRPRPAVLSGEIVEREDGYLIFLAKTSMASEGLFKGAPVTLRSASYPDEIFKGSVLYVLPGVDVKERKLHVKVKVYDSKNLLKTGDRLNGETVINTP